MAMDIVSLILDPFVNHLVRPIGRQFDYLLSYGRNITLLEKEHGKLITTKNGVQQKILVARRDLQEISPHIQEWLKDVETINSKVLWILERRERVEHGCLYGCCPNLKWRYLLGREAQKKLDEIVKLRDEVKEHVSFSVPTASMGFESVATEAMAEFESRKYIEVDAISALKDKHVNVIGLCGMGGVGKSLMAKKIGKIMKEEKIFHEVVMALVGQDQEPNKIQGEIAVGLGLTLDEGSLTVKAVRLYTRLMDEKKILIILDDVWRWIDLSELGIPSPDKHRGCKILLTSRHRNVCVQMKAKLIFTIPILPEAEAWSVFMQNVGNNNNNIEDPQVLTIARNVARECKGLPIALVTVGRSMRNKSKRSWEDALVQLRRAMPKNISGLLDDVYRPLELSYTSLESDEAKTLFLMCCLFPEDSHIPVDSLIRYGMGLHIFPDVENLEEARNRVHGLLETLKDRFLLDGSEEEDYVRMHDVVRDVAMFIASEKFLVNHNIDSKKWPRRPTFQQFTHISLISGAFDELPESLDCPNLEMLLLECNFQPLKAADSFFTRTRGLKVLEMRDFCIPSLPSSLKLCISLRTLQLHFCEFVKDISDVEEDRSEEVLSVIAKLENLEILSFSYSTIKALPFAIGNLRNLRLLDLTGCKYLNVIQPGIISSLVNLEEIYLSKSFSNWGAEIEGKGGHNVSLAELESLIHLTTLAVLIPETYLIPRNIQLPSTLTKYDLSIGPPPEKGKEIDKEIWKNYEKIVCLNLPLPHSFGLSLLQMLKNAECLYSRGDGSCSAIEALEPEGFKNLKQLHLENCYGLRHLANTKDMVTEDIRSVFPVLEKIYLNGISCLKEICNGQLPAASFEKLRHLDFKRLPVLIHLWKSPTLGISLANLIFISLDECHRLQYLFSLSIAKSLQQLEQLKVNKCNMVVEIVAVENGSSLNEIEFPKLRSLGLGKLENFGRFCRWFDHIHFPQLCNLRLNNLPKLRNFFHKKDGSTSSVAQAETNHQLHASLFNEKKSFESLQILELSELASVTNLWSRKLATSLFRALEGLKVVSCHGLRNLFPSSVAKGLVNLRELEVCDCSAMEVIIEKEVEEEEEGKEKSKLSLFPELEMLRLMTLDDLNRFSHLKHDLELKSLAHLEINNCPKLDTFNPGTIDTPKLEVLKIDDRQLETNNLNTAIQKLFQAKQEEVPSKNYSILPATDLSIESGNDGHYWDWIPMREPSGESFIAAELLKVLTLDVRGRIKTKNLSPGITYEVAFVVMLKEPTKGWEEPVNLRLILPNGAIVDRTENLKAKPRNRWIELYLGELEVLTAENEEAIEFALLQKNAYVVKKGLVIKGVIVRPKA